MTKESLKRIWIIIKNWFSFLWSKIKICWKWILKNHTGLQVLLTLGVIWMAWLLYKQTQEQVFLYKEFAKIDNRAYINLHSLEFSINENDSIKINWNYINSGKTPARYVFESAIITIESKLDSGATVLNNIMNSRDLIGTIIGNGLTISKDQFGWMISTKEWKEINSQQEQIFFLGLIKYYDIFNKIHHTWFCFNIHTDKTFSAYYKYNEAD
jgi:hypothetical protein